MYIHPESALFDTVYGISFSAFMRANRLSVGWKITGGGPLEEGFVRLLFLVREGLAKWLQLTVVGLLFSILVRKR